MDPHHIRRRRATTGLLFVGLAACSSSPRTLATMSPAAQSAQAGMNVHDDANVFALLHTSNVGEITAGMLAQRRATDAAVKEFASMMVSDHTALDQQGTALARRIAVTPALPDSTLPRLQRVELDSLRAAGGRFDRVYIAQQVVAHQRTLNLVDASIAMAQHAELKTALQQQVRPAVSAHLTRAREIQSRIGGGGMASGAGANPTGTSAAHGKTTTHTSGGNVTEPVPDSTGKGAGSSGSGTKPY